MLFVSDIDKAFTRKVEGSVFLAILKYIKKCEDLRGFNAESDYIKISLGEEFSFPYQLLSRLFCATGNPRNALNVVELGRARALADLMATQYSAEEHTSADPQSGIGVENVMKNESNCTCPYISYEIQEVFLWLWRKEERFNSEI